MNILEQAKAHPYIAGGVAIGAAVIAFALFKGGGSSQVAASGGVDPQVQAAQIGADAQLQMAQLQAGAVNAQTSSQTQLGLAYLHQQEDMSNSANAAQLAALQITTGAQLQEDLINATANIAINAPVITSTSHSNGITLPFGLGQLGGSTHETSSQVSAAGAYATLGTIASSLATNQAANNNAASVGTSSNAAANNNAVMSSSSFGEGYGTSAGQMGFA